jgi:MSHA biogenesis protein MshJ
VKRIDLAFARINRSSLRERTLLFTAAVGLLVMLWNQLLMAPLAARWTALSNALQEAHARSSAAGSGHPADSLMDGYAARVLRESALRTALASTDSELNDAQSGMIAPKAMVAVLTEVLQHQKGLTLVLLRNLPVEPLLPPMVQTQGGSASAAMGPYLHPAEIVLRGNYLDVLAYLQELESRPWGFQWRRFEFTTSADGPEYRIEFTTLSMQSNWLGV